MSASPASTLALAIGVGIAIGMLCGRLRVPAILPLMLVGVGLGPAGLNLVDGAQLGGSIGAIISVAVGLLIFEGSIHLDREALLRAPKAVWGLLSVGAVITWLGSAAAAHFLVGLSVELSLILGAVLIVTGPTVVQPILRRVSLTPRLHTALGAEAVLIDPIGVIITVTTLEIVLGRHGGGADDLRVGWAAYYILPLILGAGIGALAGALARPLLHLVARSSSSDSAPTLLCLSACTIAVGCSELVLHESGLVAAAVCGMILARARGQTIQHVQHAMEDVSGVLVGALFILLASRFDLDRLQDLSWLDGAFVLAVLFAVRPLCVFVGCAGSRLSVREKLFACFMAPRGIVAVSVASIAALELTRVAGEAAQASPIGPRAMVAGANLAEQAAKLETLVFVVVFVTVALSGLLAGPVASLLGVRAGPPSGVLLIGAHRLARELAKALSDAGVPVRIVDSNPRNVALAAKAGLTAFVGNATDTRWLDEDILNPQFGFVMAATGNPYVDQMIARWGEQRFGPGAGAVLASPSTTEPEPHTIPALLGQSIVSINYDLEAGRRVLTTWTKPADGAVPLFYIRKHTPIPANAAEPPAEPDSVIGLAPPEPAEDE